MIVTGCGHSPVHKLPTEREQRPAAPAAKTAVRVSPRTTAARIAVGLVGTPYRYGGADSSGFDCSGLVQFAYARAGLSVPRTTSAQWRSLSPVAARDLRTGDVLFFKVGGSVSHVGLYLGNGRFVHAPASGRTVSVETLASPFYRSALVRGGRP